MTFRRTWVRRASALALLMIGFTLAGTPAKAVLVGTVTNADPPGASDFTFLGSTGTYNSSGSASPDQYTPNPGFETYILATDPSVMTASPGTGARDVNVGFQFTTIGFGSVSGGIFSIPIRFTAPLTVIDSSAPDLGNNYITIPAGGTRQGLLSFTQGSSTATIVGGAPGTDTFSFTSDNFNFATSQLRSYTLTLTSRADTPFFSSNGLTINSPIAGTLSSATFDATFVAIPEPSSFALVGLAGLGLVGYRRWRRRSVETTVVA